jgi:LmbE family N-acetylglucosaminyl deacetylase
MGLLAAFSLTALRAQTSPVPYGASAILQGLHQFSQTGTVLYIAAHPDDEDTQLIGYFAQGRGFRTGYLSLNRGEGGQNLIGGEFGDELGVIRTQELLAARGVDGGRQFFTLARDFGYSKDYRDTLRRWDRREVLIDMLRVIRTFRPDVLITRFPPEPGGTHGHHTASTVLTLEAFPLAGDPKAFPDRLGDLAPWRPKRVLWDAYRPGFRPNPAPDQAPKHDEAYVDMGGYNPVIGLSYGEIAARSRSMHRSQGFGSLPTRGSRYAYFKLLAGAPAQTDPFDGIDTSWGRFPGGNAIGAAAEAAIHGFNPARPEDSVPALLALRDQIDALPGASTDPLLRDKRAELNRLIEGCLGLHVQSTVPAVEARAGTAVTVTTTVINRSALEVTWNGAVLPSNTSVLHDRAMTAPARVTQPYWLVADESPGMFHVAPEAENLIGRPASPPALTVEEVFLVAGHTLPVTAIVENIVAQPDRGEVRRPLEVVPPVSLHFLQPVALLRPGASIDVAVRVTPNSPHANGVLKLELGATPGSWTISPSFQNFDVKTPTLFRFSLQAPPAAAIQRLTADATVDGRTCDTDRTEIRYPHIPDQLLQPKARLRAVSLDLKVTARRVGYFAGAGDSVADSLALMGCTVVPLRAEDLTAATLRSLDAVVLGIRAFNVRPELAAHFDALLAYVFGGGTVVAQYTTPNQLSTDRLGPYPLTLERDLPRHRIVDEHSPVTLIDPNLPVLTTPNRITADDFSGWVQERGLNFPATWDPRYQTVLASLDPGEAPLASGLLVAPYGRGWYVYTGLSFFRQLPAGVPGAYRLFANLISLSSH